MPQYILDDHCVRGLDCNIIVTQPRRIAAVSVARRVCEERNWQLGTVCGYQIGLDRSAVGPNTRVCYVTTGVLLQKLIGPQADRNFNSVYTHIVLDEVHERDLDTDFVLLLVKMRSFGKLHAKIVLMSATIDTKLFSEYFAVRLAKAVELDDGAQNLLAYPAPVIAIEKCMFKVQEFYWEDLTDPDSFLAGFMREMFLKRYQDLYEKNGFVEFEQLLGRQKSYYKYGLVFEQKSQFFIPNIIHIHSIYSNFFEYIESLHIISWSEISSLSLYSALLEDCQTTA